MSEIKSIANGTYMIGETSDLNFEAGPGISITQPSEGTVRIASDETVLWDGNGTPVTMASTTTNGVTLSGNPFDYDRVRVYWIPWNYENVSTTNDIVTSIAEGQVTSAMNRIGGVTQWTADDNTTFIFVLNGMFDSSHFYAKHAKFYSIGNWSTGSNMSLSMLSKIVGINRKENA